MGDIVVYLRYYYDYITCRGTINFAISAEQKDRAQNEYLQRKEENQIQNGIKTHSIHHGVAANQQERHISCHMPEFMH